MCFRRLLLIPALLILLGSASAQDQAPPMPKKNPPMTPTTRLAAAKTAFLKNAGGSSIPFDVIATSIEGWGRFSIVNSPDNADIIVEVLSPTGGGSVSVSSSTNSPSRNGQPESSTTTSREIGTGTIKLTVIDGKSKSVLWMATEQPKSALRKKAQEDNLVSAAEKLFSKFHDRVEPPLTQ